MPQMMLRNLSPFFDCLFILSLLLPYFVFDFLSFAPFSFVFQQSYTCWCFLSLFRRFLVAVCWGGCDGFPFANSPQIYWMLELVTPVGGGIFDWGSFCLNSRSVCGLSMCVYVYVFVCIWRREDSWLHLNPHFTCDLYSNSEMRKRKRD